MVNKLTRCMRAKTTSVWAATSCQVPRATAERVSPVGLSVSASSSSRCCRDYIINVYFKGIGGSSILGEAIISFITVLVIKITNLYR